MIRTALLCLAFACSSTAPSAPAAALGYSGTYDTKVAIKTNACPGTPTVMDNPTVVAHEPSTGKVTITHAGTTSPGTVKSDGSFTTTPVPVNVGDGFTYSIAMTGQFTATGFTADVAVDRTSGATTCRYVVGWVGTKR